MVTISFSYAIKIYYYNLLYQKIFILFMAFIIDKDGIITFSKSGSMSQSDLEKEVNAALQ